MRPRWMAPILTAMLLGVSALTGCAAEPTSVLTIGRRGDSTTLDPIKSVQNVDIWVVANLFDGLVRVDRTGTKLEPGLAESWTVSDDGLTYRFAMRDARFSDGSPITATDAAFSLLRIRDDKESVWSDSFSVVAGAEAVENNRTLVVTLATPSAPFLATLAMPGAAVVSKAGLESMGADAVGEDPVTSGPFEVSQRIPGERVDLAKNPNFWQADGVRLDGVAWVSVPDDNTRILAVQAGELDAALAVPFARVAGPLSPRTTIGAPSTATTSAWRSPADTSCPAWRSSTTRHGEQRKSWPKVGSSDGSRVAWSSASARSGTDRSCWTRG